MHGLQVCIENTHNMCTGRVLPMAWLNELSQVCRPLNLPLHCDAARIFNASRKTGISVSDLLAVCDSACYCLSKGLGAPIGSVIVGSKDFIGR